MDIAKVKMALNDAITIYRFGLSAKPVEHTTEVDPALPGRRSRPRKSKVRFRDGSWVVVLFGGAVRVGDSAHLLTSINDAITKSLDEMFLPLIKIAADTYEESTSLNNLIKLQNVVKWYEEARTIQLGFSDGNLIPAGNGVARFDVEAFGKEAEHCAKLFTATVNDVIDDSLSAITSKLRDEVLKQVRDE